MSYSIGIDVGGTNIRVAVVSTDTGTARIELDKKELVPRDKNPAAIVKLIKDMVDSFPKLLAYERIGAGFAGMISKAGVVRNAPAFGWKDVPLQTMLSQAFNRRVGLTNDLNAICLGEYNYGAGAGYNDMLCVYVGTGVGAAAIVNGSLVGGAAGISFELGHVKLEKHYEKCGCGARGCVESLVGGAYLAARAKLWRIGDHAGHLDGAYKTSNDAYYRIRTAGEGLGRVIANACTLLNPGCLVVGGTVWEGCPNLKRICLDNIKEVINAPAYEVLVIKDSMLGDNAGVLGASTL